MSSVGEQENTTIQGKGNGMGMCLEVQGVKEMEKVRHNKKDRTWKFIICLIGILKVENSMKKYIWNDNGIPSDIGTKVNSKEDTWK